MGNQLAPGVPHLLTKHWQPVAGHPNSFRNKLTFDYTHKHITNVEDPMEIQSFRVRMRETSPYICRVLFFHQFNQNIYHVYTDEIHLQPNPIKISEWMFHKLKIVESFAKLSETYGYFRVCAQMVGSDSSAHPKVWINPDPVAARPWLAGSSESVMLADIITILKDIQNKTDVVSICQKQISQSTLLKAQTDYTTFSEYISVQTSKLKTQKILHSGSDKQSRALTLIENTLTNHNINISMQLKRSKAKAPQNRSHTHIISSSHLNQLTNPTIKQTVSALAHVNNHITKESASAEHYCNSYCEQQLNSRQPWKQQILRKVSQCLQNNVNKSKGVQKKKIKKLLSSNVELVKTKSGKQKVVFQSSNPLKMDQRKKSRSMEKPTTTYLTSLKNQQKNNTVSNFAKRGTINFKVTETTKHNNDDENKKQKILKTQTKLSAINFEEKKKKIGKFQRNPLSKLITYVSQVSSQSPFHLDKTRQNNSSEKFCQPRCFGNSTSTQNASKNSYVIKKKKYTNIPNFLLKSQTQLPQQLWTKQTFDIHSSTERQSREQLQQQQANLWKQKSLITVIKNGPQNSENEEDHRPRKNTVPRVKQELTNILETAVQTEQRPASHHWESFRTSKARDKVQSIYNPSVKDSETDDIDLIREKVEEKRVKFAQLKRDAKKILQGTF